MSPGQRPARGGNRLLMRAQHTPLHWQIGASGTGFEGLLNKKCSIASLRHEVGEFVAQPTILKGLRGFRAGFGGRIGAGPRGSAA